MSESSKWKKQKRSPRPPRHMVRSASGGMDHSQPSTLSNNLTGKRIQLQKWTGTARSLLQMTNFYLSHLPQIQKTTNQMKIVYLLTQKGLAFKICGGTFTLSRFLQVVFRSSTKAPPALDSRPQTAPALLYPAQQTVVWMPVPKPHLEMTFLTWTNVVLPQTPPVLLLYPLDLSRAHSMHRYRFVKAQSVW